MIPQPGAAPSPPARFRLNGGVRGVLLALPQPLTESTARPFLPHPRHRNCPLRSSTFAARGAQPYPQQGPRGQQRDVVAGGAIDHHEIAPPEILNPYRVEGEHALRLLCSWNVQEKRAEPTFVNHRQRRWLILRRLAWRLTNFIWGGGRLLTSGLTFYRYRHDVSWQFLQQSRPMSKEGVIALFLLLVLFVVQPVLLAIGAYKFYSRSGPVWGGFALVTNAGILAFLESRVGSHSSIEAADEVGTVMIISAMFSLVILELGRNGPQPTARKDFFRRGLFRIWASISGGWVILCAFELPWNTAVRSISE